MEIDSPVLVLNWFMVRLFLDSLLPVKMCVCKDT